MWHLCIAALAADPSYTLSFPERQAHLLQVEATLPTTGASTELMMPTWTPGSYLIREYPRHIERLEARDADGKPLTLRKSKKNRWVVQTEGLSTFTLSYAVYSRAMSVRENFVDSEMAVLNGAATFIVPVDLEGPYAIDVQRPSGWSRTVTSLSADGKDQFTAPSFDLLIDSPILVGNPSIQRFDVEGVEHVLVDMPDVDPWDSEKAATAVKDIAKQMHTFWGSFPYQRYLYLNVLGETRGGLEHLDSTLMLTSRHTTLDPEAFDKWLGLVSHEHFHAWNVKRLRPAALGPFDYESEVHTESLWIAEGFTAYYDDLLLVRAGLIDQKDYLKRMSSNIQKLNAVPGRLEQPLSRASYDAWIKHYRRDENSDNTAVSYYIKGAIVAWLLDARIRALTKHERSLDDAMRLAYTRYAGDTGYTPADFDAVLSEVAGQDLTPFVDRLVREASELDYSEALETFGLVMTGTTPKLDTPWLGVTMTGNTIATVRRDGPAWKAGLNANDEILAFDDTRFKSLKSSLSKYKPGKRIRVLVSRRGRIQTVEVDLMAAPATPELSFDPKAKQKTIRLRNSWLGKP